MNENRGLRLLIGTNGSRYSEPALEYGVWLAELLKLPVLLLGVVERPPEQSRVEESLAGTESKLKASGLEVQVRLETGNGRRMIARYARENRCITVVGPLGRPALRRLIYGRSFRRLLAEIESPIVYVPQVCLPLRKVLLCLGGLSYTEGVERLAVYIAGKARAEIALLHVVEPITLDYPVAQRLQKHREDLLNTDTPQAKNLRAALQMIQEAGLTSNLIIRHGDPVHEIREESQRGEYELIALGSPYSAHSLRHLYLPDVTAEVAEGLDRPVITARKGHALVEAGEAGS